MNKTRLTTLATEQTSRGPKAFLLAVTAAGSLLLGGCGAREVSSHESNTNWLKACDTDAECGSDWSCHCGVCTQVCERLDCPEALECLAAGECGSSSATCQQTCSGDGECKALDSDASCNGGVCTVNGHGLGYGVVSLPADDSTSPGADASGSSNSEQPTNGTDASGSGPVTCKDGALEYPVGEELSFGCGTACTCGPDGDWVDCREAPCDEDREIRNCADHFPGWQSGDPIPSDPIDVEGWSISGSELTLDIGHSGGCEEHTYALCYDPYFLESDPVQVRLHLVHDANGDGCEAYLFDTLVFELEPLARAYRNAYRTNSGIVSTNYGVFGFGDPSCEERAAADQLEVADAVRRAPVACTADDDCVEVSANTGCSARCPDVFSEQGAEFVQGRLAVIDENFCDGFSANACEPPAAPSCPDLGVPRCIDEECVYAE